ncbi:MAG: hypothetical protein J6A14_00390 [Spirochaetaceae bacterium]|nr:hypothetical protein [Spirochaetaceae bacterium]
MYKKFGKKFIVLFCLVLCNCLLFSVGYEFVNQEISEILYSVSLVENQSIAVDDTVSGIGTFRFYGENFEEAFDSFLMANRLYVDKSKDTWVVSKIRFSTFEEKNEEKTFSLDCYDLYLERIFEYISEKTNYAIIYSSLPNVKQSFHLKVNSLEKLIELILKNFDGYEISSEENTIFIGKKLNKEVVVAEKTDKSQIEIQFFDNKFNINLKNANFEKFLDEMKKKTDFQFLSLVKENPVISWAEFENQDFNFVLESVCALCNVAFTQKDDLFIFYTNYEKSKELVNEKQWTSYLLENISAENFVSMFSNRFKNLDIMILSDSSVMISHSEKERDLITDFIYKTDVKMEKHLLTFDYISASKFLKDLPRDFSEQDFYSTGTESSLFFYGTLAQFENLKKYVSEMDKAQKRISYDLLIVQTQKSRVDNWNSSLKVSRLNPGNANTVNLSVAPNFSFNSNFVSAFGLMFSAELQASIQENETEIFADTTLYGVSEVPIEFKNTNTFRYRDPYINLENGSQIQSGVTKEIVSGLVLDIVGSVSGNGTITTSVTASVSRRGADVSSNSGNPPPTSEKLVTTQVIGKSGEVIVLSGLVQNDSTFVEERLPFISKIPLLGKLFSGKTKNNEKTEMIIYLVPHLDENPQDVVQSENILKKILELKNYLATKVSDFVKTTISKVEDNEEI